MGCLDYSDNEPLEYLLLGHGFRYGSTTKIDSVHHDVGATGSVHLPPSMVHSMWVHYGQHAYSELLVFHNRPYNLLNLLFDNVPLASRIDRIFLESRAMRVPQLVRLILDQEVEQDTTLRPHAVL